VIEEEEEEDTIEVETEHFEDLEEYLSYFD
jgi:hypothetical protein